VINFVEEGEEGHGFFRVGVGVENCDPSGFLTSQVVIYFAVGINYVIHIYGVIKGASFIV
jgi:hypothetical protein